MTFFGIRRQTVRVIVIQKEKVLLILPRHSSLWMLPGGGIKKHENIMQAAIREVREETGILIAESTREPNIFQDSSNKRLEAIIVAKVKCFMDRPTSLEIRDAKFFNFRNLPENLQPFTYKRLQEFVSHQRVSID